MTPKEKALELFEFYSQCGDCPKDWAKLNAIKVADEIIEFMEADDFDSDTCYWANHSKMKYWVEVKQEIENL